MWGQLTSLPPLLRMTVSREGKYTRLCSWMTVMVSSADALSLPLRPNVRDAYSLRPESPVHEVRNYRPKPDGDTCLGRHNTVPLASYG